MNKQYRESGLISHQDDDMGEKTNLIGNRHSYCVNKNAQEGGEHEVHLVSCTSPTLPNPENRVDLGDHYDCHSAVEAAKKHYANVDGCYYCCNPCHTR